LQSFKLVVSDIGSIIFLKLINKKPPIPLVCGNKSSGTSTLASTRKSNPLFDDMATQVGIDKSLHHFAYSAAQCVIRQLSFSHPATEMTRLKNSSHFLIMPLSGIILSSSYKNSLFWTLHYHRARRKNDSPNCSA